ncbi:MAG: hypothetical protein H0X62_13930 [Bacteroidetes bacterium]|nr:hypothetical protein [Bacteroidota bacterium]
MKLLSKREKIVYKIINEFYENGFKSLNIQMLKLLSEKNDLRWTPFTSEVIPLEQLLEI